MVLCGFLVSKCLERGTSQSSADHKMSDLLRSLSCLHAPSFSVLKLPFRGVYRYTPLSNKPKSEASLTVASPAALWWTRRLQGSDQAMPQVWGQRGKGGKLTPSTPSLSPVTLWSLHSAASVRQHRNPCFSKAQQLVRMNTLQISTGILRKNALTTYQRLSLSSPGGTRQRSACKIRI